MYIQSAAMEEEEKEGSSAIEEEEEEGHWSPYTLWRTINDTKDEVKEIKQSLDEIKQLLIQQMPSAGNGDGCTKSELLTTTNSFSDPEVLFIGTGIHGKEKLGSEVLSLPSFSSTNCSIPSLSAGYHGYVATLTADGPMVCGGRLGNSIINYCLLLIKNGIWVELPPHVTMKKARMNAAAINFEGVWWVTGGRNKDGLIGQTEIWDGKAWNYHTSLPDRRSGHCLVKINTTHAFLAGGQKGYGSQALSTDAYLYSKDTGFVRQPSMLWTVLGASACALVQPDLVLVAGGHDRMDTQFFNLATREWSSGPNLPMALSGPKMFSMDGKTFLLGGQSNGVASRKIWQLVPLELSSLSWWRWAEVGQLENAKTLFDVVPITKEFCANNDS